MNLPQRKSFEKRSNHQLAVLSEMLSPFLRFGAWLMSPKKATSPVCWRRVLIAGEMHIGDLLYRTCSLTQLKQGLPQCEFYYLTTDYEADILYGNTAIREVLPLLKSDRRYDFKNGALKHLRDLEFDALLCTCARRAWPELALAMKLRIPNRVAYAHRGLSGLITHPVYPHHPAPFPAYFRDMVSILTGQSPEWPLRPAVYPDLEDCEAAEKLWHEFGYKSSEKVIAGFVTGRQPRGIWPVDWFGETLQSVQKISGCRIVLCGAKQDKNTLEAFRQKFNLSAELNPGLLGLKGLVAFLSKCSLTLTQDSGPRHLSNAAGISTIFIRNTIFDAVEAGAYCKTEVDLLPKKINRLPVEEQSNALKLVPPDKGIQAILSLLCSNQSPTLS